MAEVDVRVEQRRRRIARKETRLHVPREDATARVHGRRALELRVDPVTAVIVVGALVLGVLALASIAGG
jgi:hypothetical protein